VSPNSTVKKWKVYRNTKIGKNRLKHAENHRNFVEMARRLRRLGGMVKI
jgi:hypothetical protein